MYIHLCMYVYMFAYPYMWFNVCVCVYIYREREGGEGRKSVLNPHYCLILYWLTPLLTKNQYSWCFHRSLQTCKASFEFPTDRFLSWSQTRQCSTLLFQLPSPTQASFSWYIWCHVFLFICLFVLTSLCFFLVVL